MELPKGAGGGMTTQQSVVGRRWRTVVTSLRRMASRYRHGLGTAGPPRPLQADTPVTWVTKVNNEVDYRTSNGRFPKRENRTGPLVARCARGCSGRSAHLAACGSPRPCLRHEPCLGSLPMGRPCQTDNATHAHQQARKRPSRRLRLGTHPPAACALSPRRAHLSSSKRVLLGRDPHAGWLSVPPLPPRPQHVDCSRT